MEKKIKVTVEDLFKTNERFWQSRRMWGAGLSVLALAAFFAMPEQYELIIPILTAFGSSLGVTSFVFPKK